MVKTTTHTEEIIRRAVTLLRRKVRVSRVILFGSHARGRADEWSDVDLAVISPDFTQMPYPQLINLLVEVTLAVDPSLELHAFTPKDIKEARPTNFLGHIIAEGKVVYKGGKFLQEDKKTGARPDIGRASMSRQSVTERRS